VESKNGPYPKIKIKSRIQELKNKIAFPRLNIEAIAILCLEGFIKTGRHKPFGFVDSKRVEMSGDVGDGHISFDIVIVWKSGHWTALLSSLRIDEHDVILRLI
jgi:hypothetical protein